MATALRRMGLRAVSRPLPRCAVLSTHTTFTSRFFSTDVPTEPEATAPKLPKHIKFRMPDLDFEQISHTNSGSVTLAKWHAKEGDAIKDGTHMCEIDTPDLVFVLDAGDEGFLARILVPAETKDVPAGQPLAIIVPTEADVESFRAALKQHPCAIEGYVEPTEATSEGSSDTKPTETAEPEVDDGAAVLRVLHKLQKDGRITDEAVLKTLKSLARKNDAQLLVTYRGSFDGDTFDADFFVENATELAHETTSSN